MLRAMMLAVIFLATVPSVSAFAEPNEAPASTAPATAEAQSGTTVFFGKAKEAREPAPTIAKKEAEAKPRPLPPSLVASVDLSRQVMTVSVDGQQRYRWPISSGTSRYPTPTGNFFPQWKARMWYSKKYDNSPMPNAVFINGGVAVHGTFHTAALGNPASHGCIRLSPVNAKTFYNLVESHGMMRTRVNVHGRPNWRDDGAIARRDSRRDDDYASNDNGDSGWFWGGMFGGNPNRDYDASSMRKKDRKKYSYVYVDGVRTKVYRRKNGDYVYKDAPGRRRYSDAYGSPYDAN